MKEIAIHALQNIVMTVPFGFGVSFITTWRTRYIFWLAMAVGLGIETIQLVISLLIGFPYRIIDINDVLLDAIGALLGYGLFRAFAWVFITLTQRLDLEHSGLSAYINNVVNRA